MAVVVALQVFKDTGIGHECLSLVRNRNNQVQCLFPKPINFQAEKNSSCPTSETGLRGMVAPTAGKTALPGGWRPDNMSERSRHHCAPIEAPRFAVWRNHAYGGVDVCRRCRATGK